MPWDDWRSNLDKTHLAVNHLSHFYLTLLLLELLKKTHGARIVNVASMLHMVSEYPDWPKIASNKCSNQMGGYGNSKLANILFSRKLGKILKGSSARSFVIQPGFSLVRFRSS